MHDDFRRAGEDILSWIADYWKRLESLPVRSRVNPGDLRKRMPTHPPEKGESLTALLKDVERLILPGLTHWQSPNSLAYFPANTSPAAVLGDLLSSELGVQGMLWATSPCVYRT